MSGSRRSATFWSGLGSALVLSIWVVIGKDGRLTRTDLLFPLGGAIAYFGVWVSSHARWRDVAWALVPFLVHGFVVALLFVWPVCTHVMRQLHGPHFGSDGPYSGWNATWVGDVDGDHRDDFLLSTPFEPDGSGGFGIVRIVAARDGSTIFTLRQYHAPSFENVARAGDVDGDGRADLLVHDGSGNGSRAISGDGARQFFTVPNDWGSGMRSVGDLDGDGRGDVLIAEPLADRGGRMRGVVRIVSGADGSTLREHVGEKDDDSLGWDACDLGDVDEDGTHDYAISTSSGYYAKPANSWIEVHSGRDGRMLWRFEDPESSDWGIVLEPTGDIDGDHVNDLLFGKPTFEAAAFALASGRDGRILWRRVARSFDSFGSVGDVDGDGCPDLRLESFEESRIESGRTGRILYSAMQRSSGTGSGDANGDGCADILRITNRYEPPGAEEVPEIVDRIWHEGSLEVVSGKDGGILLRIDGTSLMGAQ